MALESRSKRKILITNDDGIGAPGIIRLAEAAKNNTLDALGKVLLEASKGMKDGYSRADN